LQIFETLPWDEITIDLISTKKLPEEDLSSSQFKKLKSYLDSKGYDIAFQLPRESESHISDVVFMKRDLTLGANSTLSFSKQWVN